MVADLTALFTATAPLAHGSFGDIDAGNATCFRRFDIVFPDGRQKKIPGISAGSVRGILRRIVMRDLFDRAGISRETMPGKAWDRLYGALANGGHLEKSEGRVDPSALRSLRADLPPLSLFGAALFSFFLEGRLKPLGQVLPVCKELVDLGMWEGDREALPWAESLISEVGLVRHVDREFQTPEVSGVTPMPTTTETLCIGTRLLWRVRYAGSATEIERAILPWAFARLAAIGGKHNAGFGAVDIEYDGSGDAYQDWLDGLDAAKLTADLRALAARLE